MRIEFKSFISLWDLKDWINSNGITKDNIQGIYLDANLFGYVIMYWEGDIDELENDE